jgi:hypothetical protein
MDKIEFDNIPYLIGFDNGVYNLQSKEFLPKNKDYHITMTTNYDYESVIHNLDKKCQGGYAYVLPSVVLSKGIKDGPNPEISGGNKNDLYVVKNLKKN